MAYKSKTKVAQKYSEIIAQFNAENQFTDPEFPTNDHSIGNLDLWDVSGPAYHHLKTGGWDGKVSWLRVKVIT